MNPPGPTSHFFYSQRLRLHYVDWGNANAPPVLLVHGGQDHCRNWDAIASDLAGNYHVMAPDLRGHGDSAWCTGGGYVMADFVYDLAQLARQKTAGPISLIGHSLGGAISLLYAGLYPDRIKHLIIIEGTWQLQMPHEPIEIRMPEWIDAVHALTSRVPILRQDCAIKTWDQTLAWLSIVLQIRFRNMQIANMQRAQHLLFTRHKSSSAFQDRARRVNGKTQLGLHEA